ncbi:nectin-4 [Leuresthes tenuis]|uniref:nectin-4 n=1 Tax=Leuresthes tenuis TaxID=355514 RepID=UPI003B50B74C
MESTGTHAEVLALLFLIAAGVQGKFLEPLKPITSLRSLAETQTRFPCHYKVEAGESVVQVTWSKELPDGSKDQIITAHFTDGQTEFGRYSRRVRFESNSPTENSALLLPNTEVSDEGTYTCHISTFPNGNFERRITLTVWSLPISSLDSHPLVEGQQFSVVASCRAVGRPLPLLSWDTDLPGKTQNRSSEGGAVSTHYSLHPLRSMNGKKLDCLVWHPGLKEPRRIPNRLVVQYPPDAIISSSPEHLYVGLKEAELLCKSKGNPEPQQITWTRRGGALPAGVSVIGGKLVFERALRSNDSGIYECVVNNSVGVGKTEYTLEMTEKSELMSIIAGDNLLLIVICASAGAVVLILVIVVLLIHRRHRHKTRRLQMQLSEKTEEINSLSRQASFRRLNSVSTDPRVQAEEFVLRIDSRLKNSKLSLERPIYKGSQSTLGGKWGHVEEVELDELGRPVIWHDGEVSLRGGEMDGEKEERRRRVELYLKTSNMSLDSGLPSSLVPMKAQQDDGSREPDLGHLQEGHSPPEDDWALTQSVVEEQEDDEDGSSIQITEALNNHFYYRNGFLRPKPNSNAVLLHPSQQLI